MRILLIALIHLIHASLLASTCNSLYVPFPHLLPLSSYETLLQRQQAGEILELEGVARPGISKVQDGRLTILQGAGRFEKASVDEPLDLFVSSNSLLPAEAVVIGRNIPRSIVYTSNLLSSRGMEGSNEIFVDFILPPSSTYHRILIPKAYANAPTSKASKDLSKAIDQLTQKRGAVFVEDLLKDPNFRSLNTFQQHDFITKTLLGE